MSSMENFTKPLDSQNHHGMVHILSWVLCVNE